MQTLVDLVDRPADGLGDRLAAVHRGQRVTYRQLARRVRAVACALDGTDVSPGGSVATLLGNSLEHLELWLAIPASGRVLCDLNTRLTLAEHDYMVTDAHASLLVCDDSTLDIATRLLEADNAVRSLVHVGDTPPPGADSYEDYVDTRVTPLPRPSPDDTAGIFYTGGTTGTPKGVLHTHASLVANARHLLAAHPFEPTDRYLHAAPMFHLADGSFSLASTAAGACHFFLNGFSPERLATSVTDAAINQLLLVPSMIAMLLADPVADATDWACVERLFYGASPMPAELQRRVSDLLGCELAQMYGFTEGGLATDLDGDAHRRGLAGEEPWAQRLRSAGLPLNDVDIEVRDSAGQKCETGAAGEVHVRGPNIMSGYHGLGELTGSVLDKDGWYATGDVGHMDDGGFLFIVDRAKDMIITGAENVYSPEVESVLASFPGVAECAVIGIPDDTWGETVHAFVNATEPVDPDDLDAHCRSLLAGYKIPRSYTIGSDPLPRSAIGKVLKTELREPYWKDRDRRVN